MSTTPPTDRSDSYYGRRYLKGPVWKREIVWYFWVGGIAGVSAPLALFARLTGNRRLARSALAACLAGVVASPPLLVADLGRPKRFLNMIRVFKPTSPMSVGSWVLAGFGASAGGAAFCEFTGMYRKLGELAELPAALLGPALATYTGALLSDTAVPVWHEARRQLPLVFAGSAMAAAGGLAVLLTPARDAAPARRLAVTGAALELAASAWMERRLGELASPYHSGEAAVPVRLARGLTAVGAGLLAFFGRRQRAALIGGGLLAAGSLAQRMAVFRAGVQGARETSPARIIDPPERPVDRVTKSSRPV